ncbi:uncharacterized protein (UPF0335 family) [Hephaestia caeni]|uniref:Uncharacterized protein (UPF0335 family) n=1 Tax=Hephaestia caeni TaxID=645617 RepID=A0A397NPB2_9SPHN|nr:uncharacterized protein (UPF0335 family) [Hephaestia caeni]
MTKKSLAEQVPDAVAAAIEGEVALTLFALIERMPAHIRDAQPSKRAIVGALKGLGWRPLKRADDTILYRAPQIASDPLARRDRAGGNIAADELRLLIERAERLEEEKKGIADDIKDVMAEAKSRGYDAKAIRAIIAIRKKDKDAYQEEQAILDLYLTAMGMA